MQQQDNILSRQQGCSVPLSVEQVSASSLPAILRRNDVLMVVLFSAGSGIVHEDPRQVCVGVENLGHAAAVEVWRGSGQVTCHRQGRIYWSENGEVLFGHMLVEETAAEGLDASIEAAYNEIDAFLGASPYPFVFRFWHFIPRINGIERGIERYRAFCVGRHSAVSLQSGFESTLPAASAVGTDGGGVLISFASGRSRPVQVENPRQVSAFRYPPLHAPRSPLFSRAVCMNWDTGERQLFVSGTASIVGHESRHVGNVVAQTAETCRNIDAVLNGFVNGDVRAGAGRIANSGLRVYLRHPEHLDTVAEILGARPGLPDDIIYLQGDLCRSELLLEMEGFITVSSRNASG